MHYLTAPDNYFSPVSFFFVFLHFQMSNSMVKKIITLVFMVAAFVATGSAQQIKVVKKNSAEAAKIKTFKMNKEGVDILKLDQKFVTNPPKGSVYDAAKKPDALAPWVYDLKKKGKVIGFAYVVDKKLKELRIWANDVALGNGVKVGMSMQDVLQLNGVEAKYSFYFEEGIYSTVSVTYKGVQIDFEGFSESGEKKLEKMQNDTEQEDFDYDAYNYPEFEPSDISQEAKVTRFIIGEGYMPGMQL